MSAEKTIKDQEQAATKETSSTPAAPDKKGSLSTEDLDKVSGGINPQPLPPGRSRLNQ